MLSAAIAYAAHGWPVLPLRGKVPISAHGVKDATCDAEKIRSWWASCPRANIGLAMGGPARRVAIDVDVAKGGADSLAELERVHGRLSETLGQRTGSGGLHLIFIAPEGVNLRNAVNFGSGLDSRTDGGYIVVAPSVHATGHRYRWLNRLPLAPLPAWLADLLKPRVAEPMPTMQVVVDTQRMRRARAYIARMPPAISGSGGHAATWRVALVLVRGFGLPPDLALEILMNNYNWRCEPPWSRRELEHKVKQASASRVPIGYLLERRAA